MFKKIALPMTLTLMTIGTFSYQASAQNSQTSAGTYLHNTITLGWEFKGKSVMKVVDAETPSGQAISAKTKKRHKNAWDVSLWIDMEREVKKGDKVEMRFWARTAKAPKSKEQAEFVVFVGRNEEPYDNIFSENFSPTSEWKAYTLSGIADANYSAGKLKAEYQIGKQAQTVEFGAMYVSNLGPVAE